MRVQMIKVLLLILSGYLMSCQPLETSAKEPTLNGDLEKHSKEKLLEFLRLVKTGIDQKVYVDEKRTKEVVGIEVFEWEEQLGNVFAPRPAKWRFNNELLDKANFASTAVYHNGTKFIQPVLVLPGVESLACLTPVDLDQIFGSALVQMRLKSFTHDPGPNTPRWYIASFLEVPGEKALIRLEYAYVDEVNPRVTCLSKFSLLYGQSTPLEFRK